MKKKTKKKTPTWYRKKCVAWAKNEAKKLVNHTCEHCGRRKADGWQIHGSHIYPEGTYVSMSADVDNILALCARCHTGGMWKNAKEPAWHTDPIYFGEWFKAKYPERYTKLKIRSQLVWVVNWEARYNEIKKNGDKI